MNDADPKDEAVVAWHVHKFGGTSVANADCFRTVAQIVLDMVLLKQTATVEEEEQQQDNNTININTTNVNTTNVNTTNVNPTNINTTNINTTNNTNTNNHQHRIAVVLSAMGGTPKTTDLLLQAVQHAASRHAAGVDAALAQLVERHETCIRELLLVSSGESGERGAGDADVDNNKLEQDPQAQQEDPEQDLQQQEVDRLIRIVHDDVADIRDILTTVSLLKWQATRIAELVAGYGELWSTQILTVYLNREITRRRNRRRIRIPTALGDSTPPDQPPQHHQIHHVFCYLDARRVVTMDEGAIQNGAVVWDLSAAKLREAYDAEWNKAALNATTATASHHHHHQSQPKTTRVALHWVMTGYVASNTEGVATTLQRDGSDYSASILGRLLSPFAQDVTIWTDVDGVLSADPRLVPLAQVVPQVSYNEAMELAYFGAKVIHPKTMQPAIHCGIPIYIRNTFRPHLPGSRIFTRSTTDKNSDQVVCAFSSIDHMAIVNVEGSGLVGILGVAKRLFGTLEQAGVNVVLISQASSEHSITFATTEKQADMAKTVIEEEFRRELDQSRISNVDVKSPCSIIAAVGDGMSSTTGCSGRFFSALGDAKINIIAIAQGCSERNISAVVRSEDSVRALRAVHAAFRLSHTTIRIAVVGMNEVGESLLRLMEAQRGVLRSTFEVDLQVVCVVLPKGNENQLVVLQHDTDGSADSITTHAVNEAAGSTFAVESHVTFEKPDTTKVVEGGPDVLLEYLWRSTCTNHVIFDCTNDSKIGNFHAAWLRAQVDVVTANNTGLSGSKVQRQELSEAERAHGKQSAKYLREVTVGGGLPILRTLRSLLDSGDNILRVDGIFSVSLSYIMFRISPPPDFTSCIEFDERFSAGAFVGDLGLLTKKNIGSATSFSEAVKEAISLGLMEEDPTMDLNNEYTCRVMMVLARELDVAHGMEVADIQKRSEKLLEEILHKEVDYHNLSADIDAEVKARVDAASSRGCVLRHISSVDVRGRIVEVKLVEVPEHHIFAVTPPSCECVRFFTHRHRQHPLIIQGPSAGVDSTASALLAELLHLMRGKSSPRSVALSRSISGAVLHS